jgi:hypothetical protein
MFFCNEDDQIIPHILTCSYRKENQIINCHTKVCKKLKVQSKEAKEIIHRTITKMIKGPQDEEDKEKFKIQTKYG